MCFSCCDYKTIFQKEGKKCKHHKLSCKKGKTGSTGSTGNTGEQGIQGMTGETGASGQTGQTGSTGGTGGTGGFGQTGSSGGTVSSGGTGGTGGTGSSGGTGGTGSSGGTGVTGGTGSSGQTGQTGSTGGTGLAGNTQANGSTGTANFPLTLSTSQVTPTQINPATGSVDVVIDPNTTYNIIVSGTVSFQFNTPNALANQNPAGSYILSVYILRSINNGPQTNLAPYRQTVIIPAASGGGPTFVGTCVPISWDDMSIAGGVSGVTVNYTLQASSSTPGLIAGFITSTLTAIKTINST